MASVQGAVPPSPGGAPASLLQQILRRKPVGEMAAETGVDSGEGELARTIGLFQLTLFGVGATIGTGIFIVLTQAVPVAGPAVIWSFVIAGAVAGFTAICYAELASAVPVSGSSYSYAYATLGEGVAMIVAACLLLEYGVSAAAVAVGWSQYLNELFQNLFSWQIPEAIAQAPEQGGVINVPAVLLIVLCTTLLLRGSSESAKVNAIMVLVKIGVLALFVVVGVSVVLRKGTVSRRQFVLGAGAAGAVGAGLIPAEASTPGETGTWLTARVVSNDGSTLRVKQLGGPTSTLVLAQGAQPILDGPVALTAFAPGLELVAVGTRAGDGTFVATTLEALYRIAEVTVTRRAGDVLETTGGAIELSLKTLPRGGGALGHHVEERAPAVIAAGDRIVALGRLDPANGALDAKLVGRVTGS